ncbi:MAG TPA: hypothetical protein VJ183_04580 [Chloroflexia bacterium]|nr:hypothetical protein [Chloroflexia bacterium]
MEEDTQGFSWYLATWWGLVSSVGVAITFMTMPFPLIKNEFAGLTPAGNLAFVVLAYGGLLVGMISGALTGFGQWLILRAHWSEFKRDFWWIPVTFLGLTIASVLGATTALFFTFAVDFPPREAFDTGDGGSPMLIDLIARGALLGAVVGVVLGIFQWVVMRNQARNTYLWLLGCIIGWTAAGATYHAIYIIAGGPTANPIRDFGMNWQTYYSAKENATTAGWLSSSLLAWVILAMSVRFLKFRLNKVPSQTL